MPEVSLSKPQYSRFLELVGEKDEPVAIIDVGMGSATSIENARKMFKEGVVVAFERRKLPPVFTLGEITDDSFETVVMYGEKHADLVQQVLKEAGVIFDAQEEGSSSHSGANAHAGQIVAGLLNRSVEEMDQS